MSNRNAASDAETEEQRRKWKENSRRYRKRHPERRRATVRKWYYKKRNNLESYVEHILAISERRANRRGLPWRINKRWMMARIKEQNYCCLMSGHPFLLDGSRTYYPWAPSLDRIDNSKGYTTQNTRVVCLMYNLARNNAHDIEILELAQYLVKVNSNCAEE